MSHNRVAHVGGYFVRLEGYRRPLITSAVALAWIAGFLTGVVATLLGR